MRVFEKPISHDHYAPGVYVCWCQQETHHLVVEKKIEIYLLYMVIIKPDVSVFFLRRAIFDS